MRLRHLFVCGTGRADLQFAEDLSGISVDDGNVKVLGNIQTECSLSDGRRSGDDYQRFICQLYILYSQLI